MKRNDIARKLAACALSLTLVISGTPAWAYGSDSTQQANDATHEENVNAGDAQDSEPSNDADSADGEDEHISTAMEPAKVDLMSVFGTTDTTAGVPGQIDAARAPEATMSASVPRDSEASMQAFQTADSETVSLNDVWRAQSGGTDKQYTITKGGTYELTADLAVKGPLQVNAPDEEVVIELNGHTLTSTDEGSGYALYIPDAKSVRVVGDENHDSSLKLVGETSSAAVRSSASSLVMENVTVYSKPSVTSLKQLNAYGIDIASGSVTLTECAVELDQSNQATASTTSGSSASGAPAGIWLESNVSNAVIENCEVEVTGSPAVTDDNDSVSSYGHASGLYSTTSNPVTITGGSYSATIANGSAAAIAADYATLRGDISLCANGSGVASGLRSLESKGITLDCNLSVSYDGPSSPAASTALYTSITTTPGFTAASGFSGSQLGVLVGSRTALDSANGSGEAAISCNGIAAATVAAAFVNALPDGACTLTAEGDTVLFILDENKAPAEVVHDGTTVKKTSAAEALADAANGDTVRLLSDLGSTLKFTRAITCTIDLNGHVVDGIAHSSKGSLTVITSSAGGEVRTVSPNTPAALTVSEGGTLNIGDGNEAVLVSASHTGASVCAISMASRSTLNINDAIIQSEAQLGSCYGIYAQGRATVHAMNTSISASTSNAGVIVCGCYASALTSIMQFEDCAIEANGVTSEAGGISTAGSVLFAGSSPSSAASIRTSVAGDTSAAFGIRMTNPKPAIVENASISVTAKTATPSNALWCLMAGQQSNPTTCTWVLDGNVELSSPTQTEILHSTPLLIGDNFSSTSSLRLYSKSLANDVALSPASEADLTLDGSGSDVAGSIPSGVESSFSSASGSTYDGCSLIANGNSFKWNVSESDVAAIEAAFLTTNYTSIEAALTSLGPGETLKVLADCSVDGALSTAQTGTLDLNGHTVNWTCKANAALTYEGTGTFTITDSVGTGALAISLGSSYESSATTYKGIAVTGGGKLVVDAGALSASYVGASSSSNEIGICGIAVQDGSLSIHDGVKLRVHGCLQDDSAGATFVDGVYLDSAQASSTIDIEAGASIEAVNTGAALQTASNITSNANTASTAYVTQVFPDENSNIYREMQDKFVQVASFDTATDSEGFAYGSSLYYAAPMTLDDDTMVWAFSNVVEDEDIGKLDSVKASRFFVRSICETPTRACAIRSGSSFAGNTSISEGAQLVAQASNGDAYGAYADGTGAWSCASSGISATGATRPLRVALGYLVLNNYVDFSGVSGFDSSKDVIYPYSAGHSQRTGNPVTGNRNAYAQNVFVGAKASVNINGSKANATSLPEIDAKTNGIKVDDSTFLDALGYNDVTIRFSNVRNSSGTITEASPITVGYGSTIDAAEKTLPTPSDYTSGATSYRFIGWDVSGDSRTFAWSAEKLANSCEFTNTYAGSNYSATLSARYVAVPAGFKLVTFDVDGHRAAYAVRAGDVPTYVDAAASTTVVPSKIDTDKTYSYTFSGWARSGSPTSRYFTLPAISADNGDVTYEAAYSPTASAVTAEYYTWHQTAANTIGYYSDDIHQTTLSDVKAGADDIAAVGSKILGNYYLYTLLGWGPRRSDVEALYTTSLPANTASQAFNASSSSSYFGVYSRAPHEVDVTFNVGEDTYATADGVLASMTLDSAFADSTNPAEPVREDGTPFLGWASKSDAASALEGGLVNVGDVSGTADSLDLYAVFGEHAKPTLIFMGTDRTSVAATYQITWGSTVRSGLAALGANPPVTWQAGSCFAGWEDATGKAVDVDADTITSNTRLYPRYVDLTSYTSVSGVAISLSKAHVADPKGWGYTGARLTIGEDRTSDTYLSRAFQSAGYATVRSMDVSLIATAADGSTTSINSDFGTAVLTITVGNALDNALVKVFWNRNDSSIGKSADKTPSNGKISFNLNDYYTSDEGNNLIVGSRAGEASSGSLSSDTDGSSPSLSSSSASGSLASGSLSGSLSSSGLSGFLSSNSSSSSLAASSKKGSPSVLASSSKNSDAASDSSRSSTDEGGANSTEDRAFSSTADNSTSSLSASWSLVALAAVVLFACFAVVRWFLKRRHGEDDDLENTNADRLVESIRF